LRRPPFLPNRRPPGPSGQSMPKTHSPSAAMAQPHPSNGLRRRKTDQNNIGWDRMYSGKSPRNFKRCVMLPKLSTLASWDSPEARPPHPYYDTHHYPRPSHYQP
jgi:hypothetical protein